MEPRRHRASCPAALALQWLLATTATMNSVACALQASGMARAILFVLLTATVWQKSKAQAEDAEEPSYVSKADEVLGARWS